MHTSEGTRRSIASFVGLEEAIDVSLALREVPCPDHRPVRSSRVLVVLQRRVLDVASRKAGILLCCDHLIVLVSRLLLSEAEIRVHVQLICLPIQVQLVRRGIAVLLARCFSSYLHGHLSRSSSHLDRADCSKRRIRHALQPLEQKVEAQPPVRSFILSGDDGDFVSFDQEWGVLRHVLVAAVENLLCCVCWNHPEPCGGRKANGSDCMEVCRDILHSKSDQSGQ
mmetsp:Transcript_32919/g.73942  ORF Transcript_32919/g.73942 Transcript_32919/m.73942 type:complete len:225 (+) Transcript_32919:448-1122(+)